VIRDEKSRSGIRYTAFSEISLILGAIVRIRTWIRDKKLRIRILEGGQLITDPPDPNHPQQHLHPFTPPLPPRISESEENFSLMCFYLDIVGEQVLCSYY
jgi:hypothetical protein